MEQAAVGRRMSIPQVDPDRHPFLDGDDAYHPAVRPSVTKKTPQSFHMESAPDEWRPSIAPMPPTSANAAGVTDAFQRHSSAPAASEPAEKPLPSTVTGVPPSAAPRVGESDDTAAAG